MVVVAPESNAGKRQFADALRAMGPLVEFDPLVVSTFCLKAIANDESNALAYALLTKALRTVRGGDLDRIGDIVRQQGLSLVARGELAAATTFFACIAASWPDICGPYAQLYAQIDAMSSALRSLSVAPPAAPPLRRLVISIVLWGQQNLELFTRVGMPALLAPGNLPALSRTRRVEIDIYTTEPCIDAICASPAAHRLSAYAEMHFIRFAREIVDGPEYTAGPALRQRLAGGFHHVSIERARALKADLIWMGPYSVYSDGALANFARYIDDGHPAVLGPILRAQAETLTPRLEALRDNSAAIAVPPRRLVEFGLKNLHHTDKGAVLVMGNRMLAEPAVLIEPHPQGAYLHCFQLYPMAMSAETLRRDIKFDYGSVVTSAMPKLLPDPAEWPRVKVIADSDEGMVVDLSHRSDEPLPDREFDGNALRERVRRSSPWQAWAFSHRVNVHGDATLEAVVSYDRQPDGSLRRKPLPVASRIELSDAWLHPDVAPGS